MKKYFFLLLVFALTIPQFSFAQNKKVKENYFPLKEILANKSKLGPQNLKDSLLFVTRRMETYQSQLSNQYAQLQENKDSLGNVKLYGIIALFIVAFLCLRLFLEVSKRSQTNAQILESKIDKTKYDLERYLFELEKEAVRIDNRLVQILHEQLSIVKEERAARNAENPLLEFIPVKDHRLPIKVGEEIHRMRKRIENMDKDVKGLAALVNSINRLVEELTGNGYEMEELMGKKYVDGMKMEARFVDNPDIPPGEERITDVLRPEIKYKGEVIQVAKVEVGKSY